MLPGVFFAEIQDVKCAKKPIIGKIYAHSLYQYYADESTFARGLGEVGLK